VVFKQLISQLSSKLDAYDVILGKQKYLAGNVSRQSFVAGRNAYIGARKSRLLTFSISRTVPCLSRQEAT
jgi:hypothetical protein